MNFKKNKIYFFILLCLLLVSFAIRYSAIHYSLPDGTVFGHTRSYFNDEDAIVADTAKVALAVKENPLNILDPGRTIYPMFGRMVSFVPLGILYLKDYKDVDLGGVMKSSPQGQAVFYSLITYSGRLVSFCASFISIVVFFFICLELGIKKKMAIFLSFVYSFIPVDIVLSVQSKANVLMNLIILLILYACLRWLKINNDKLIWLSALLIGLAMGTRLNGVLSVFIVFFVLLLRYKGHFYKFFAKKKNLVIFILTPLGLLLSSPHLLIKPGYLFWMLGRAGSGSLTQTFLVDWQNVLGSLLLLSGGWFGLILFTFTFIFSIFLLKIGTNKQKLVALWFLFYFLIFVQTYVPVPRYVYPLLPLWFVLLAILTEKVLFKIKKSKLLIYLLLVIWGISTILFGLAYIKLLKTKPVHLLANEYVEETVSVNSRIGVYNNERYYLRIPLNYEKYQLNYCRDWEDGIKTKDEFIELPEYLVVRDRGQKCLSDLYNVSENYHLIKEFHRDLTFGCFTFKVIGHWNYLQPSVSVYNKL